MNTWVQALCHELHMYNRRLTAWILATLWRHILSRPDTHSLFLGFNLGVWIQLPLSMRPGIPVTNEMVVGLNFASSRPYRSWLTVRRPVLLTSHQTWPREARAFVVMRVLQARDTGRFVTIIVAGGKMTKWNQKRAADDGHEAP